MNYARAVLRCVAEDREHRIEISQTNTAPRRGTNQLKRILENLPAKICRDLSHPTATEMKSIQRFAIKDQNHSAQRQQYRKAKRYSWSRNLAENKSAQPEDASRYQ